MVFTDPPYNVRIDGNVCRRGRIRHREFAMAAGEMSEAQFTDFLIRHSGISPRTVPTVRSISSAWTGGISPSCSRPANEAYTELQNLCVWNKDNGGLGSLYRSKHELVFVFKHGTGTHVNNIELGRFGRNRTNVWNYPGGQLAAPGPAR
jgi:hypothetical protein